MINSATGELIFENCVKIGSSLTREEFLNSQLGKGSTVSVCNEPWCSYRITDLKISGETFVAVIYFKGSNLESISLANSDPIFGMSWEEWSEEKELARNKSHENWLANIIGNERSFIWGTVWCGYDSKSGGSSIHLRYK